MESNHAMESNHSSFGGYTPNHMLQAVTSTQESDVDVEAVGVDYQKILEHVRNKIAEGNAAELAMAIGNADAADTLKNLIVQAITQSSFKPSTQEINPLIERIYQDMAGLGTIGKLLQDPTIEEININGFRRGGIEVIRRKTTEYLDADKCFSSPKAMLDTVKKMVRMGGMLLDASCPKIDSFLGDGTRISAYISPLARDCDGVVGSIRKQNSSSMTKQELIDAGSVTEDMIDFLKQCLLNKICMFIAGSTSAGKTTDMTMLLNEYSTDNTDPNSRIYLVQDALEIILKEWDEIHSRPVRVNYFQTKPEPNPITMRDAVKLSLRFDPNILAPAECRGEEAYEVVEAANTDHTVLTTLHANTTEAGYYRLLSMATMAGMNLSEDMLLRKIVEAFPISAHKRRLKDGTRVYDEIYEATGVENGRVEGHLLFKFVKTSTIKENGRVTKVNGYFEQVGTISDPLRARMEDYGDEEVKEFLDRVFPKKGA